MEQFLPLREQTFFLFRHQVSWTPGWAQRPDWANRKQRTHSGRGGSSRGRSWHCTFHRHLMKHPWGRENCGILHSKSIFCLIICLLLSNHPAHFQSFKTNDLKCAKKVRAKIILLITDWNSREKTDNMSGS